MDVYSRILIPTHPFVLKKRDQKTTEHLWSEKKKRTKRKENHKQMKLTMWVHYARSYFWESHTL